MSPKKTFVNPFDGKLVRHNEPTGSGGGITISSFEKQTFSPSNGQSIFALAATPIANSEIVARNGQILNKGVGEDYTLSGATMTLAADVASTITTADKITVHYAI